MHLLLTPVLQLVGFCVFNLLALPKLVCMILKLSLFYHQCSHLGGKVILSSVQEKEFYSAKYEDI